MRWANFGRSDLHRARPRLRDKKSLQFGAVTLLIWLALKSIIFAEYDNRGRYFDEILRKLYSELTQSTDTFEASKGKGQDLLASKILLKNP